ncbi:DUF1338 domain-containing protein [Carboxylicivirga sp. N1Y90]|uniref:DUF1338 domain-containing protein n=1 Tax=Carboxylicivirga fragile TaxID=3417571 RepID=UPI003D359815|nr:DUF1338 domain-containing protein [Marinilabiliaceae bacterium N1Y90]
MTTHKQLLDHLFNDYQNINPSVKKIHRLFQNENESIINDHIAFRTFNYPEINIDVLAKPFLERGYKETANYRFEQKKLTAKHYEYSDDPSAPKIFISQLETQLLSQKSQDILNKHVKSNLNQIPDREEILTAGNIWEKPKYKIYESLLEESEYAAWLYAIGFKVNHFTVLVNTLNNFESLEKVNSFLKQNGFPLNTSGGEIKGTPQEFLEQSSTLADMIEVEFYEGSYQIPSCYYEFARRYKMKNGSLFNGFIAKSADKIFESTNIKK